MNNKVHFRTVLGGALLTLLWICCFLFIKSTLVIEFGGGINANFKRLSLIIFYPFNPPANLTSDQATTWPGGAIGFFTLIGGLAVCVLWIRFFSDEIA